LIREDQDQGLSTGA